MTESRAILVSHEEAHELTRAYALGWEHLLRSLASRYDDADGQLRWDVCVVHGGRKHPIVGENWICTGFEGDSQEPCRIVSVVLVEVPS